MRIRLIALLLLVGWMAYGQDKDMAYYYNQAREAYRAKSYPKFYEMIKEANKLHPYHQGILYQLGLASALTGRKDEALENLRKAILIDASFKLEGLSDLNSIKDSPDFKKLIDLQKQWQTPVIHSDTAFVIRDRSLHVEGIEYDATHNILYLGSIHKRKIVRVTIRGAEDFCPEEFNGMTSIFGIKADVKKNVLWACSSPIAEMKDYDSTARSAVFKFELSSGRLLEKIQRPTWEKTGVFGDLVLDGSGTVYVSDSELNMVFVLNEKTLKLEPFFTSIDFMNIQGLAFTPNGKYLFISDYIKGIFRLELKNKTLTQVACDLPVSLKGIDGLLFNDNSLIAIQNGTNPLRVMRYRLNNTMDRVTGFDVIDRKHPAFNEPTIGTIAGNTLYYIANSQWSGYDANHHIKPDDQLQDIVILKTDLSKNSTPAQRE